MPVPTIPKPKFQQGHLVKHRASDEIGVVFDVKVHEESRQVTYVLETAIGTRTQAIAEMCLEAVGNGNGRIKD